MKSPFSKTKKIFCLLKNFEQKDFLLLLKKKEYLTFHFSNILDAMAQIYNDPPDIILLSSEMKAWKRLLKVLKKDPVYGHLPVILILHPLYKKKVSSLISIPFDDFVFSDDPAEIILHRIRLRSIHANRYLDANPLTHLPGNFSILSTLTNYITSHSPYGLGYLDIDNFKAFNDVYGFARGDEMIRMTARILTNVIRGVAPENGFVGHVGGDDFIFIIHTDKIEACCSLLIQNFDLVAPTLADEEDRIRGYIESEDRQGNLKKFPLPTISIAVIDSRVFRISHPGEASAIASEIKKAVKKLNGSNFMINRRTKA